MSHRSKFNATNVVVLVESRNYLNLVKIEMFDEKQKLPETSYKKYPRAFFHICHLVEDQNGKFFLYPNNQGRVIKWRSPDLIEVEYFSYLSGDPNGYASLVNPLDKIWKFYRTDQEMNAYDERIRKRLGSFVPKV